MMVARKAQNAPAKASDIYSFRGMWRDQLLADKALRASAFRIGYALSTYMTMADTQEHYLKSGKLLIWPSQEKLHEQIGSSLDTIRLGIKQLIANGHLKLTERGNRIRL